MTQPGLPPTGPLVSVIISTRNEAAVIATLLRSLRAQTYPRLEIILVDNASTDYTCALAQPYVDQLLQAGPERSAQRNVGARASSGSLLVFLDADMRLEPGVIAEAVQRFATRPGLRLACIPERSFGQGFWASAKALERNCYVDEPAVMAARIYDRGFFESLGGFDETLTGPEDWDLTQRARGPEPLPVLTQWLWHDEGRIALGPHLRKTTTTPAATPVRAQASQLAPARPPGLRPAFAHWAIGRRDLAGLAAPLLQLVAGAS